MNTLKLIFILFISISMSQCGSSQQAPLEVPFNGGNSYYETWIAGVQGGGSGVNLFLDFKNVPEDVILKEAYFQEMRATITLENGQYVARFKTALNNARDIVMSKDPVEEMVNTPSSKEMFKFPLEENEAGITYMQNGALRYAKIANITFKESKPLPSQRPQNGMDRGQE
ncbi:hypothetical protein EAX61_02430 [Dokdonia sinensis]|uniref:Uncharacterized protein n=1 Tax=Dokdonia sinensis TaxID=2479847 RepID=A0A3M0GKU2_9FLAO|nr:hypothetical protein [Dokdonia sinensis]RMB63272.1 hypothetical protein EAX61_02430 [Dokdonia sinensis]